MNLTKSVLILLFLTLAGVPLATQAVSSYDLAKEIKIENHYDANLFAWQNQVCAAGPYANEIKTYCTELGQNNWTLSDFVLTDSEAEFIGLEEVFTFKDDLYFVVDRGLYGTSNNDTETIEIWRLTSGLTTWEKVFSYANDYAYYLTSTTTAEKIYFFLYRYDTNPSKTIYYTSTDGENWDQAQSKNTPASINGVIVNNDTVYIYNSSYVYALRSSGYWAKKYDSTAQNTDLTYSYINALTSWQDRLYLVTQTYTYASVGQAFNPQNRGINNNDLGYTYKYKIMSSDDATDWTSKILSDPSLTGAETSEFHFTADGQLYLLAQNTGKQRDVLWKIKKNIRKMINKKRTVISKTTAMKNNNYHIIDCLPAEDYFYFADSYGNIYTK